MNFQSAKLQCAVEAHTSQIPISCSEIECRCFIPRSGGGGIVCMVCVRVSARAVLADKATHLSLSLGLKLLFP